MIKTTALKVTDPKTGESRMVDGFHIRPNWHSWVEAKTVKMQVPNIDGETNGTSFNVIIYPAIDKDKDWTLIPNMSEAIIHALGKCLADAGKIKKEDIG